MDAQFITWFMSALAITFTIINFALARKDKAEKDVKDNSKELIEIEVFKANLENVQDDVKEIKQDMKDIKQIIFRYKDEVRDVANEVVQSMVQVEMKKHIEKYHANGK